MRAGMGIPHDNRVSGAAEALFRENGMTYTVASDIVEILNMIAACPVAEDFPLFCPKCKHESIINAKNFIIEANIARR